MKQKAALSIPMLGCGLAALTLACVRAPNIVVMDSKTVLEEQAAGEFHALENDLAHAQISPRGEPIVREQLASKSQKDSALGEVAQLYARLESDADWVDRMLVAQCIGEAQSGLLQPTPDRCQVAADSAETSRILGRSNLDRRQLWRLIQKKRSKVSMQRISAEWRKVHLQRVVCGGLVQTGPKVWAKKECAQ